jgi:hypothetical protein
VIYPGSTPVGNATLVVANVLTCNKHTPKKKGLPAMGDARANVCTDITTCVAVSCRLQHHMQRCRDQGSAGSNTGEGSFDD